MAGEPWGCHGSNGMQAMQANDAHASAHSFHASGGWALGACEGYIGVQPAAHDSRGEAMRDESSAPVLLTAWTHRRLAEPGAGPGTAMDEDECMGSSSVSGGQTPVAGAWGVLPAAPLRVGPSASFVASAKPSSTAHRRPGTAASADTVHKWEQLLRDHPNDPMVSAFSLARLLFVRCAFWLCVRREGVSALVYLPCKVNI